jgi:hypothetical protein
MLPVSVLDLRRRFLRRLRSGIHQNPVARRTSPSCESCVLQPDKFSSHDPEIFAQERTDGYDSLPRESGEADGFLE